MKAALLTEINKPLELCELEPLPFNYGQVFVRVLQSGICGAQLQECRGEKGNHFPRLMGHEGVGVIDAIGPGVRHVKPGDKCIMHWRKGDGIECESPRYSLTYGNPHSQTEITGGQVVTFATHSTCSENRLTTVPIDTPNDLCALLGCGLSTALGTIESEAKVKFGETVLIIGCGGLGLNLIRAAKLAQAGRVSVMDKEESKFLPASVMGVTQFIHSWSIATVEFDVIVDTTGNEEAIKMGLKRLAPSGRFIMVGQPRPDADIVLTNARHMFDGTGKTIMATQGGRFQPSQDIPRYVAMHRAGLLNLDGLISHRFKLSDINQALDVVRSGGAGRVMLEMNC